VQRNTHYAGKRGVRMNETAFWNQYAERYGEKSGDVAKDGAGAAYYHGTPRILAVLKEPNDSCGADLRQDFLNVGARWAIWHRLSEWAAGILHEFPPYEDVYGHAILKNDALRRIAVVNLKKLSGGASIDDAKLQRCAFRDRDFLRTQICSLKPTLILACGTFEPLLWLLEDSVSPGTDPETQNVIPLQGDSVLVQWRHPSRCIGRKTYDGLRDIFKSPLLKGHIPGLSAPVV